MESKSKTASKQPPEESVRAPEPVAVIDIGTSSIRMAIGEIDESGGVRTLETLTQAISLGQDTFTKGFIEKSTTEACVQVLRSYRHLLKEYRIERGEQIRVVATSAVREASNRLSFLDRVYSATGLKVEPIDEADVNRITYLGIQPLLDAQPELAETKALVVEVGGGSTDLLLLRGGAVLYADNCRLGSLRLFEALETARTPLVNVRRFMENQINRTLGQIRAHLPQDGQLEMIAMGGDVRFAVSQLLPEWDRGQLGHLTLSSLERFTDEILEHTADRLVQKYHLTFPDAETLGPALLAYVRLAHMCRLERILVASVNLRDGLLKEVAAHNVWTEVFRNQIVRSALDLGRQFNFDEEHARHVAELSQSLFRSLQDEHQLEARHEMILHIAALLHDIGRIVNLNSHHKHSMYLIGNSKLFGLSQEDLLLVSLVARYHRRASPKPIHEGYATLGWENRIAVAKLAAILRVADALDRAGSQRIHETECAREDGRLVISVPHVDDLSLERLALKQKDSLFEEIFGMQVLLRTVRRQTERTT